MSSRNTYTALTPEYADFGIPHSASSSSSSQTFRSSSGTDSDDVDSTDGIRTTWYSRLGKKCSDFVDRNAGLLLVALAQGFFAFMNVAVKKLNSLDPPVPTMELIFVRMGITYVCSISYMYITGVPDPLLGPKEVRALLLFRGFIGFFGLFGVYYSLQYLSLSDATVLTFLAPMCTVFTGAIFLGESFSRRQVIAGIVSLFGVVLIARPSFLFGSTFHVPYVPPTSSVGEVSSPADIAAGEKGTQTDRLIAVGMALVGVVGATGAYTSIRAIGKRAHPLHSLTFFSTLCVLVSTVGMLVTKTPVVVPTRLDWVLLLLLIGIFGCVAQVLLTMGLQRETAGRGTIAVYTQIVFASILERIFFRTVPSALSIIGTLLIIGSALYVALSKDGEPSSKPKTGVHLQDLSSTFSRDADVEQGLLSHPDGEGQEENLKAKKDRHVHFVIEDNAEGDNVASGRS